MVVEKWAGLPEPGRCHMHRVSGGTLPKKSNSSSCHWHCAKGSSNLAHSGARRLGLLFHCFIRNGQTSHSWKEQQLRLELRSCQPPTCRLSRQVWPHDPCHCLNGHECEQTLGDSKGQGSLACCSSWGCKESAMTEQLNDNKVSVPLASHSLLGARRTVIITTSIFVMKPL